MSTKSKKYRFVSSGNVTIVLSGTRQEPIINATGNVIGKKNVPPLLAEFKDGYFETDNEDIKLLLTEHCPQHWQGDVFWHPSCLPAEHTPEDKTKAKALSGARLDKAKRRAKQQENAIDSPLREL